MHRTSLENLEERHYSGDLAVRCSILKCTLEHRLEGISWIHVWDRDKKRAFVSMVMNNAMRKTFGLSGGLLAS